MRNLDYDLTSLAESLDIQLEIWSEKHNIPVLSREIPTTIEDVCYHLSFLGTRIRSLQTLAVSALWSDEVEDKIFEEIVELEEQMVHDSRVACLILVTACGKLGRKKRKFFTGWLKDLLEDQAGSSEVAAAPHPSTSAAGSPETVCNSGLPIDRIIAHFPAVTISVLARRIMGEPVSVVHEQSEQLEDWEQSRPCCAEIDRELHGQDIELLRELSACLSLGDVITDDEQGLSGSGLSSATTPQAGQATRIAKKLLGIVQGYLEQINTQLDESEDGDTETHTLQDEYDR
ncbi:hypothetical protein V8F20_009596 [Naviculisporaceae sp. PSN 640]